MLSLFITSAASFLMKKTSGFGYLNSRNSPYIPGIHRDKYSNDLPLFRYSPMPFSNVQAPHFNGRYKGFVTHDVRSQNARPLLNRNGVHEKKETDQQSTKAFSSGPGFLNSPPVPINESVPPQASRVVSNITVPPGFVNSDNSDPRRVGVHTSRVGGRNRTLTFQNGPKEGSHHTGILHQFQSSFYNGKREFMNENIGRVQGYRSVAGSVSHLRNGPSLVSRYGTYQPKRGDLRNSAPAYLVPVNWE